MRQYFLFTFLLFLIFVFGCTNKQENNTLQQLQSTIIVNKSFKNKTTNYLRINGGCISKYFDTLFTSNNILKPANVNISTTLYSSDTITNAHIVFSIIDKKNSKTLYWNTLSVFTDTITKNEYTNISANISIKKEINLKNNIIRCYIWNKNIKHIKIKNLKIVYNLKDDNEINKDVTKAKSNILKVINCTKMPQNNISNNKFFFNLKSNYQYLKGNFIDSITGFEEIISVDNYGNTKLLFYNKNTDSIEVAPLKIKNIQNLPFMDFSQVVIGNFMQENGNTDELLYFDKKNRIIYVGSLIVVKNDILEQSKQIAKTFEINWQTTSFTSINDWQHVFNTIISGKFTSIAINNILTFSNDGKWSILKHNGLTWDVKKIWCEKTKFSSYDINYLYSSNLKKFEVNNKTFLLTYKNDMGFIYTYDSINNKLYPIKNFAIPNIKYLSDLEFYKINDKGDYEFLISYKTNKIFDIFTTKIIDDTLRIMKKIQFINPQNNITPVYYDKLSYITCKIYNQHSKQLFFVLDAPLFVNSIKNDKIEKNSNSTLLPSAAQFYCFDN